MPPLLTPAGGRRPAGSSPGQFNVFGTNLQPGSKDMAMALYGDLVPEPSSLALIGVGALHLSHRRRRCTDA